MRNSHRPLSYLLLLSSYYLLGCTSSSPEENVVIEVKANDFSELSISEIAQDIQEIPLQKTEESLIGSIVTVKQTKKHIFVLDANGPKLMRFDRKGNFEKLIGKKGEGPGEYTGILGIAVDQEKGQVYVATFSKIIRYNFEGQVIDESKQFTFPEYIDFENEQLQVFTAKIGIKNENGGFDNTTTRYLLDRSWQVIDSLEVKRINLKNQMATTYPRAKFKSSSSTQNYFYYPVLVQEPLVRDTLYSISDKVLQLAHKLNFGTAAMQNEKRKAVNIKSICKYDRYLISEYNHNRMGKVFLYDFKTQQGYNLKEGINGETYTDNEPIELFPLNGKPNMVYFTGQRLENTDTEEEPNPTLYLVSLKAQ